MACQCSSQLLEKGKRPPFFKREKKEKPGNYRPVNLTSVSGTLMEQILQETMLKYTESKEMTVAANMTTLRANPPSNLL